MASFDPYHKWLGIPPRDQPPHHYRLLGIELYESDPEVIEAAAERHVTYLQTVATGPQVAESQRLLNEISAARRCLLTPSLKEPYDAQLRTKLGGAATTAAGDVTPPPMAPPKKMVGEVQPPPASTTPGPKITVSEPANRSTNKAGTAGVKKRRKTSIWPLVAVGVLLLLVSGVSAMFALGKLDHLLKQPAVAQQPATPLPTAATAATSTPPPAASAAKSDPPSSSDTKAMSPVPAASAASSPSATPTSAAVPALPPSSKGGKLVAHYTFDDPQKLVASAEGETHGINHGGKSEIDDTRGTVLSLDGNAFVELPLKLSDDVTIAFWMSSKQTGGFAFKPDKGVPILTFPNDLRVILSATEAVVLNKGEPSVLNTRYDVSRPRGGWSHLTIVRRKSSKTLIVYGAGKEVARKTDWQETKEPAGTGLLGKSELVDTKLIAQIDDLRIYDYAMTEAEVKGISRSGVGANNKPTKNAK